MKVFSLVRQPVRFAALAALSISAVACSAPTTDGPTASGAAQSGGEASGSTVSLSGAGASFPAPLYQRWFSEYQKVDPSVQVSYQSVGSGAGVEQFLAGTVDFGATDSPLEG